MSIETRMSAGSEADISRCGKPCLLCPRKRTFGTSIEMSAKATSGHPQNNGANRKTASRRSLRNPIRYFIQCASRSITGYQICNLSPLEKCKVKSLPSCTVVAPTAAPPVGTRDNAWNKYKQRKAIQRGKSMSCERSQDAI